jgi:hypothetical protein
LHRAGELDGDPHSSPEEAVPDLCRTRADMLCDLTLCDLTRRADRLGKFQLRRGRPWRGGSTRTRAWWAWLRARRLDQPAMTQTFGHYLAVVEVRNQALDAMESDIPLEAGHLG